VLTLRPARRRDLRPGLAPGERRRSRLLGWVAGTFTVVVVVLVILRWNELADMLSGFPIWAAVGAIAAQLCWLGCRGEAWRLALNAVGPAEVPRASAHAANSLAFLIGAMQSLATVPVRALALRRLAPHSSPTLEQTLVADAPVLALEGTLMGLILLAAVATTPQLSGLGAAATVGIGILTLAALTFAFDRLHGGGLTSGLRVIGDRKRRLKLLGLVMVMSGLGLARSWFVLSGFDLPHGFASVAAFLAALGVVAVLPIGIASSPAAALALFGAGDAARAAAAGVGMAATSLVAVVLYGAGALGLAMLDLWLRRGRAGPVGPGPAAEPDSVREVA
jgi:hypothetical protein